MKVHLTFLFVNLLFTAFSQNDFWSMEPNFIQSNNIATVHEKWTFYGEDGIPDTTRELRTFYFDEKGKKKCIVERNMDIVETTDSTLYFYDGKGREVLRKTHIEINPRNLEIDRSQYDWMDTLEERQTIYERRKIMRVDHDLDTLITKVNRRGDIVEENTGNGIQYYFYKRKKLWMTKRILSIFERNEKGRMAQTLDTIVTVYNNVGNPISTTGKSLNITYSYENDLLISKVRAKSEFGKERTVKHEYEYNEKGQLIAMKRIVNNRVYDWEKYEYDANGIRVKEISIHSGSGKVSLIREWTFNF